jgi:transcriptional antiterminator RfaH
LKTGRHSFPATLSWLIELQWHAARWAPGICGLIMAGAEPAKVPDGIIAEIRRREIDGLIDLPKAPSLRRGDRVKILQGPFRAHLAIYPGMKPRQRVEVLLQLLGSQQRVTLPKSSIEPVRS